MENSVRKDVSINLNCYTIRFRMKNDKVNYLSLSDVFNEKSFKEIMESFTLFLNEETYSNGERNRILYLVKLLTVTSSMISGVIHKGYSGQETYVDELKAKKANNVGTIKKNQYNSMPFYFNISINSVNPKCFIFLAQGYRRNGFKEIFEEAFKQFFKKNYSDKLLCEVGTLSIASLFEKYIKKGTIRRLRFKKHRLTQQAENILREEVDKDNANYEMELAITAKKQSFMGIKKDIKFSGNSFIELFKIEGFDYDEAFADVTINGRQRMMNITNPNNFGASFDITNKVPIITDTNQPDFTILNKEAISIILNDVSPYIN